MGNNKRGRNNGIHDDGCFGFFAPKIPLEHHIGGDAFGQHLALNIQHIVFKSNI